MECSFGPQAASTTSAHDPLTPLPTPPTPPSLPPLPPPSSYSRAHRFAGLLMHSIEYKSAKYSTKISFACEKGPFISGGDRRSIADFLPSLLNTSSKFRLRHSETEFRSAPSLSVETTARSDEKYCIPGFLKGYRRTETSGVAGTYLLGKVRPRAPFTRAPFTPPIGATFSTYSYSRQICVHAREKYRA